VKCVVTQFYQTRESTFMRHGHIHAYECIAPCSTKKSPVICLAYQTVPAFHVSVVTGLSSGFILPSFFHQTCLTQGGLPQRRAVLPAGPGTGTFRPSCVLGNCIQRCRYSSTTTTPQRTSGRSILGGFMYILTRSTEVTGPGLRLH